MAEDVTSNLRRLPAVDRLLQVDPLPRLLAVYPRPWVVDAVRSILEAERQAILQGSEPSCAQKLARRAAQRLQARLRPTLRPVINATGIVLHTNLGRAPLEASVLEAATAIGRSYSSLEFDLATGRRGSRYVHVVEILRLLTGAEDALVVNNNAAAVLLALHTLARGRQVIVSRGQLVEIGGGFRVPEVMASSGARLVEVGTTNKTYLEDYRRAVTSETALFLRVHTSNYRLVGFTYQPPAAELAGLGHSLGLPVMEDLGSGLLIDLSPWRIKGEPLVSASLAAGLDVVTFSGDKLLGGPQAGIILGRQHFIEPMKKNPLLRALRVDKLTLGLLESTLRLYLDPQEAVRRLPVLRFLTASPAELEKKARLLAGLLQAAVGSRAAITVVRGVSQAGGGSLPGVELPTYLVQVQPHGMAVETLAEALREADPPVIVRRTHQRCLLDVRTITEGEFPALGRGFQAVLGEVGGEHGR